MNTFNSLQSALRHLLAVAALTLLACGLHSSPCSAQLEVASHPEVQQARTLDLAPSGHVPVSQPTGVATPASEPVLMPVQPMSRDDRIAWAVRSSVGTRSLGVGVISAAWGIARDSPDEYGPSWRGFGKRHALRLSGVTIGNSIEAGFGGLWGEDPRYERAGEGRFLSRVARAGKWTVLSRRADGRMRPAYARGIGIVSSNFITNAWRVDSDRSAADAWSRSAVGITSRGVSNLFDEFWPDMRRVVLRR